MKKTENPLTYINIPAIIIYYCKNPGYLFVILRYQFYDSSDSFYC